MSDLQLHKNSWKWYGKNLKEQKQFDNYSKTYLLKKVSSSPCLRSIMLMHETRSNVTTSIWDETVSPQLILQTAIVILMKWVSVLKRLNSNSLSIGHLYGKPSILTIANVLFWEASFFFLSSTLRTNCTYLLYNWFTKLFFFLFLLYSSSSSRNFCFFWQRDSQSKYLFFQNTRAGPQVCF